MNPSTSQPTLQPTANLPSLMDEALPKDLDNLKVSELRLLLTLSRAKIGEWVPLVLLRGNEKPTSSFSRSITKLVENQWIATKKDPQDGRGKQLRLTTKGRHRLKPLLSSTKQRATPGSNIGLPQTTRRHYLTAKTALNIPSKEGTGDWHFFEMFQGSHGRSPGPFFVAGINIQDTYDLLGDVDIEECSSSIREGGIAVDLPVFAASHYRAMADLIYQRLNTNKSLRSLEAGDWFPSKENRIKLGAILNLLVPNLSKSQKAILTDWMKDQDIG